ncbi:MAG: hypothetical protein BAJALOKI3v1_290040 [Promethearchaeota archaeon]|nr:MAG: hypothetical protein BAJALOKI3v1_290040 [Candidatus Lokiarchaeota archaeon]
MKVEKKPKRENLNNLTIKEIELEKFDFSKDARLVRTIYGGKVKLIFLKKPCDILLSRDLDFTINPSLNILKKELDEQWDKGYREFLRDYSSELESKRIDDLSEKEVQSIQKKLTELRLLSNENFIDTFENIVVRSYYFFAVFKTFTDIFTEKYDIPRSEEFIREMMTNLALFNVFKYEFKTSPLINEETYFFDKLFLEKTKLQKERVRSLYNLSYQIIYLYLGVQRIRILGSVLEQRGVDREFVDKIEDLSHMIMKSTFMHMSTDTNLLAATCFASFVNVLDLRDKMPLIEIAEKAGIVQSMLNTKIVRLIEVDEEIFFENSKPIKSTKITTKLKDRLARALAREMFRFYYTILSREKRYKPSQANELINEFYNDFVFFKNNNLLFKDKGLTKVWKDIEKALERYQNILKKENSKRIEEISQSRIPLF